MPRLPDRFDLWVRKARQSPDPARQADYVLGALSALPYWHFFNQGTLDQPVPAETELDGGRHLLLFSGTDRIVELLSSSMVVAPPLMSMPTLNAFPWVLKQEGCVGILVNPGEDAFVVSMDRLGSFYAEWQKSRARNSTGYWIPNPTSEEEDFWQEHGL